MRKIDLWNLVWTSLKENMSVWLQHARRYPTISLTNTITGVGRRFEPSWYDEFWGTWSKTFSEKVFFLPWANPTYSAISHLVSRSIFWLVVYLPVWKIWLRQLGWWNSQYMEKKYVPNFHQSVFVWPFLTHRPTIRPGYPSTLSLRAVIWHRPTLKDASWSLRREKPRTKWGVYSKPCLMTPEGIILISWFIYLESSVCIYMCVIIYIYISW